MGSDFLFATPSFLSGIARLFDFAGQFDEYNDSPNGEVADWIALLADWRIVGHDLAVSMDNMDALGQDGETQAQESAQP
jgi:hypothetical protein